MGTPYTQDMVCRDPIIGRHTHKAVVGLNQIPSVSLGEEPAVRACVRVAEQDVETPRLPVFLSSFPLPARSCSRQEADLL